MAWSTIPVTGGLVSKIVAANFNEVRAAIIERGGTVFPSVSSDGAQARTWITTARTYIEAIIPNFCDPDNSYAAFTKSTLLVKALGAGHTDWLAASPATPPYKMWADEINELRLVLNKMVWTRKQLAGSSQTWGMASYLDTTLEPFPEFDYRGSDVSSWDDAWTAFKTFYDPAFSYWGVPYGSGVAGFHLCSYEDDQKRKAIWRGRNSDLSVAILNSTVLATKAVLTCWLLTDESINLNLYEAASFGGTPVLVDLAGKPVGSSFEAVVDVTAATPNTTEHYSLANASEPALDDIKPADVSGTQRGLRCSKAELLVQYDFVYKE